MGGLLEKWSDVPVDPANGISGPRDVARHWREVGEHSRMPIDGSVMIDNPVQSSYPPSRVYKVIQKLHNDETAAQFLRRAREALFAFNQNIEEKSVMIDIVNKMGLDGKFIVKEAEGQTGQQLLNEDFALTRNLGVRGFPTIVIVNQENKGIKVVGSRPLESYVSGLSQILNEDELTAKLQPALSSLLATEKLLFAKEIEVMYDVEKAELQAFIEKQLTPDIYEEKELLGEKYFVKK